MKCTGKGSKVWEVGGDVTTVSCNTCGRLIACDTGKLARCMFDKDEMEGESINYTEDDDESYEDQ